MINIFKKLWARWILLGDYCFKHNRRYQFLSGNMFFITGCKICHDNKIAKKQDKLFRKQVKDNIKEQWAIKIIRGTDDSN